MCTRRAGDGLAWLLVVGTEATVVRCGRRRRRAADAGFTGRRCRGAPRQRIGREVAGLDGLVVGDWQCGKCFFRRLRFTERNGSLELPGWPAGWLGWGPCCGAWMLRCPGVPGGGGFQQCIRGSSHREFGRRRAAASEGSCCLGDGAPIPHGPASLLVHASDRFPMINVNFQVGYSRSFPLLCALAEFKFARDRSRLSTPQLLLIHKSPASDSTHGGVCNRSRRYLKTPGRAPSVDVPTAASRYLRIHKASRTGSFTRYISYCLCGSFTFLFLRAFGLEADDTVTDHTL